MKNKIEIFLAGVIGFLLPLYSGRFQPNLHGFSAITDGPLVFGNLFSAVLHASLLNGIISMVVFWGILNPLKGSRLHAWIGAGTTALWFYFPQGIPNAILMGYLLFLTALFLIWDGKYLFLAGILGGLTLASQATLGLIAIILLILNGWTEKIRWRPFFVGLLLTALAIHLWVGIFPIIGSLSLDGFFSQSLTLFLFLLSVIGFFTHANHKREFFRIGTLTLMALLTAPFLFHSRYISFAFLGCLLVLVLQIAPKNKPTQLILGLVWLLIASIPIRFFVLNLENHFGVAHPAFKNIFVSEELAKGLEELMAWEMENDAQNDELFFLPHSSYLYFIRPTVPFSNPEKSSDATLIHELETRQPKWVVHLLKTYESATLRSAHLSDFLAREVPNSEVFFLQHPRLKDYLLSHYVLHQRLNDFEILTLPPTPTPSTLP